MIRQLQGFWRNESGATAIEYGLIALLIVTGSIAAMIVIGHFLSGSFNSVGNGLSSGR